ncbi:MULTISPECIES: PKD domain-containing protein [Micrococcaceae]|uniref:PKD domain-containing protein n=1 Tax=Micrococcaceae TaxID=1268 RepID=UPI001E49CAC1|nr:MULTISPECIES: PKD domain-containing protein [Micrococcaceae]
MALFSTLFLFGGGFAAPALADSAPIDPNDPKTPVTVTADSLPTVQHDGVAWQAVTVGTTVYVAGKFNNARPSGAAAGTQLVPRRNILAFDLATGALKTSFTASLNGQALAIAASPDGSRIYVGGDFTTVNGVTRNRIAALNPDTGAPLSGFAPSVGGSVRAIVADGSKVWFGGLFGSVGSSSRNRLAAVNAGNGALLPWAPNAANGKVNALALSPDGSKVVVGGAFTTLNGSNRPGYGLGMVDAVSGANLATPINDVVRNGGTDSAVLSLSSDGTSFYGTGYIFGTGGNLEGAFAANWSDARVKWVEDCHGDSYGAFATDTAVYVAGHPHYCGNLGGYPETTPRTWHRAVAFGKEATGTLTKDIYGYPSFTGQPAPAMLNWFPDMDTGTASGQSQGPWAVTGNNSYVVMVGEFKNVNQRAQQGLSRFAVRSIAPNDQAPRVSGASFVPSLSSPGAGQVRVQWQANWDRDNSNLTYTVLRDGDTTPVYTASQLSTFWQRPTMSFTDSGLTGGQHSYRISVRDPLGNTLTGNAASITVAGATNGPPTASFTSSTDGLTAAVNGSASVDPGGSIAGYAWQFGDGGTESGVSAQHTYAAAGTYTVTLVVTDNSGNTDSVSAPVTVSAGGDPDGPLANDAFGRTVTGGWGSADLGGGWSTSGGSTPFAVSGGAGRITLEPGRGPSAYLGAVTATDTDVQATLSFDKVPNGGGAYAGLVGRRVGTAEYRARIKLDAAGVVTLRLIRLSGGVETTLVTANTGLSAGAGNQLQLRFQVTGTGPSQLRAKVWSSGSTEPAGWGASTTDTTAGLQAAGSTGVTVYTSSAVTNLPVRVLFDDFSVRRP